MVKNMNKGDVSRHFCSARNAITPELMYALSLSPEPSCNQGPQLGPPGYNSGSETMQKPSSNQSPQFGSPGNDHQSIMEQFRNSSGSVIVLTYVYDCIILARDRKIITKFIATLKFGPKTFDFTNKGTISKYLGKYTPRHLLTIPSLVKSKVSGLNFKVATNFVIIFLSLAKIMQSST